jgi:hypothetical protein
VAQGEGPEFKLQHHKKKKCKREGIEKLRDTVCFFSDLFDFILLIYL